MINKTHSARSVSGSRARFQSKTSHSEVRPTKSSDWSRSGTKSNSAPARTGAGSQRSSFGGGPRMGGARPVHGGGARRQFNSPRPSRGGGGGRGKFGGERIDFSRFIKKAQFTEEKPYAPKHTFAGFNFSEKLFRNILKKGYASPKPIQDQAIPVVTLGRDIFGLANTGTGKTAAFLLPLIERISKNKKDKVLIMAPTRELASQIEADFRDLAFGLGIFSAACVGGMPIMKQIRELRRGVSFIIGTPGRLRDLIDRKDLDLSNCTAVVLDEADRMLDMGFRDDMAAILSMCPKERQTLFFSATLSPEIKKLTQEFLKDPLFISVISGETAKNIDQDVVRTKTKEEKIEKLHDVLIKEGSSKVLIFREMKHSVDALAGELSARGFKVGSIHGDKRNRERVRTLDMFKSNQISILIATDVAARGLDIPNVTHVINYDIPSTYDTYVHRIGRTGRADKKGIALTFVPM